MQYWKQEKEKTDMFSYFRFAHPELYRQFSEQSITDENDQTVEVDEIDQV